MYDTYSRNQKFVSIRNSVSQWKKNRKKLTIVSEKLILYNNNYKFIIIIIAIAKLRSYYCYSK